ncbi:MAG TPA: glycosyltransferase family 2 protein [Rhizomicrobium sp.]|jgi:glycosyltransferase involved in cell wall biosynthesis|nr:glycosyltransferase family 2 protein [Rhizomicrobium sp.]
MTGGISCIVPAFNEGARIRNVLQVLKTHPLIGEIIVVDDGSTDDTRAQAASVDGITLIAHRANLGKSKAVCSGIRASSSEYLLFLDADLIGLDAKNLTDLIEPVTRGCADVSISLRGNAMTPFKWIGLDYVSGERVLRRDLLADHLDRIEKLPNFGLEVYLNKLFIQNNSRIRIVRWDNVVSPLKSRKHGMLKGVAGEIRMLSNIIETIALAGTPQQISAMIRARV